MSIQSTYVDRTGHITVNIDGERIVCEELAVVEYVGRPYVVLRPTHENSQMDEDAGYVFEVKKTILGNDFVPVLDEIIHNEVFEKANLNGNNDTEEEDDDDNDIVTLLGADGEEIDFTQIAGIAYGGKFYAILQPVELLDGMDSDEALVFKVSKGPDGEDKFEIELDDHIIDAVFAEYNRLLDEAMKK